MGRDIYTFIERRKNKSFGWECVETDESLSKKLHLYRFSNLFALLSYNAYEGKNGVFQRPLQDWAASMSKEANSFLFMPISSPVKNRNCLFSANETVPILQSMNYDVEDYVSPKEAISWIDEGLSFLPSESIISNPDQCFWNWCSSNELEWALKEAYSECPSLLNPQDDYLKLIDLMKKHERDGYEVRLIYSYDFATPWLDPKDR